MAKKVGLWLGAMAVVFVAGTALGAVTAADHHAAQRLNQFGERFGWGVHLAPPDPCWPPDPCKATLKLGVNTHVRTDLDQQMTLFHEEGESINPCVRVLHQFLEDGSMSETIDILGSEDAVQITVPEGFQLVETDTGYALAPIPADLPPPQ